jgi:hypothetical protein
MVLRWLIEEESRRNVCVAEFLLPVKQFLRQPVCHDVRHHRTLLKPLWLDNIYSPHIAHVPC